MITMDSHKEETRKAEVTEADRPKYQDFDFKLQKLFLKVIRFFGGAIAHPFGQDCQVFIIIKIIFNENCNLLIGFHLKIEGC